MKIRTTLAAFAFLLATGTAAAQASDVRSRAAEGLSGWGIGVARELAIPQSALLSQRTRELAVSVTALCKERSPGALAEAQAAWTASISALRSLGAMPIGPTLQRRTLRRIDFWPTRPGDVEAAIVRYQSEPQRWDRIGASAQGLPALEYLLFPVRSVKPPDADAARCAYVAKAAEVVAEESAALARDWQRWLDGEAKRESSQEVDRKAAMSFLTDGVNALVGVLEQMRSKRLTKPLSRGGREPAFDAWRSGHSRTTLAATWEGVRIVILGKGSAEGLAGALRANGRSDLVARLEREVKAVTPLIAAVPESPVAGDQGAHPTPEAKESMMRAANALGRLQDLVAGDVAAALEIAIGFNEADGD